MRHWVLLFLAGAPAFSQVNSIGARMAPIQAGAFRMGNNDATPPGKYKQFALLKNGDYDEKPVHDVRLSYDFSISETEITDEQFARFRYDYQGTGRFTPYATGMSWFDAQQFTEWLSRKEKKQYRLPTEAEWEYAARAGAGLKNMDAGPAEWVLDWYGMYMPEPQTDPVGPSDGWARVVRGGGPMGSGGERWRVDGTLPFFRRAANRASAPPEYRGNHHIGFRIVEAALPAARAYAPDAKFPLQFVKQSAAEAKRGPDPKKPWFRQRQFIPIPPENAPEEAILAAGLDPGVLGHLHSGSLTVCPNGDLLAAWFTSSTPHTEYEANATIAVSRLRFGAEEWDMPVTFFDYADVNDQSSLLFTDRGVIWHLAGGYGLTNVPFKFHRSRDNGATWERPRLPVLLEPLGGYYPQPINTAFRSGEGTLYFPSDGVGGESMLWATKDDGATWYDTGGRTGGRHTVFARLKDGSILGIGGKNTDIDGYMPQSLSRDNGKTWTVSKTVFPALASNQRPSLVRLQSGRLLFASDWQDRGGKKPAAITERGAFVALSDDEGRTWKIKTLPGTLPHESVTLPDSRHQDWLNRQHKEGTIGYSVLAQGPNGAIHLVSSMNHPSQHWEMNEAWILSPETAETREETGRFLRNGAEVWRFDNGAKQYEVTWKNGRKAGVEAYWRAPEEKAWEREHRADGTRVWTQYWRNGKVRSRAEWRGMKAHGAATMFDYTGRETGRYQFVEGELAR